ncbi:porin [Shewanella sp. SNU WT4]|uniref:porin n=1 Tax=Shewanella sp. SNU WT4 TaxID=2590015 RepID=UPI00112EC33B|nr:porin [Shewanella sp. SNU WT4]QDF66691.1 porin [Shewanella sp. SNU WT4]
MKKTLVASALAAIIAAPAVYAVEVYHDDTNSLTVGGIADVRVVSSHGETDMVPGWSRIFFTSKHQLNDGWSAFSNFEWSVNPFGNTKVNVNTNGQFSDSKANFLGNRLGYVGLGHDQYGQLSFGKQWSVWYDLSGGTNNAIGFDGNASGTYTYNKSDGSFNGTGRPDKAIQYRNAFGDFSFGLQFQLQQNEVKVEDILDGNAGPKAAFARATPNITVEYQNTYGFSATYAVTDKLNLIAAANTGELTITEDGIQRDETDYIYGVGMTYGSMNDGLYLAANVNKNQNHDTDNAGRLLPESVGVETFASYTFANKVRPIISYNILDAGDEYAETYDKYGTNDEFKRETLIVGVHYLWTPQLTVYTEGRFDFSDFNINGPLAGKAADGEGDAFVVGMAYKF